MGATNSITKYNGSNTYHDDEEFNKNMYTGDTHVDSKERKKLKRIHSHAILSKSMIHH